MMAPDLPIIYWRRTKRKLRDSVLQWTAGELGSSSSSCAVVVQLGRFQRQPVPPGSVRRGYERTRERSLRPRASWCGTTNTLLERISLESMFERKVLVNASRKTPWRKFRKLGQGKESDLITGSFLRVTRAQPTSHCAAAGHGKRSTPKLHGGGNIPIPADTPSVVYKNLLSLSDVLERHHERLSLERKFLEGHVVQRRIAAVVDVPVIDGGWVRSWGEALQKEARHNNTGVNVEASAREPCHYSTRTPSFETVPAARSKSNAW